MNQINSQSNHYTTWDKSLKKGKITEQIFKEDFADYLNIGFIDISENKEWQKVGVDLLAECMNGIDIKSYNDNNYITLEEMSIIEAEKTGWIYTSKANYFAFVSKRTRTILILKNNNDFKNWWQNNKNRFELKQNETRRNDKTWHSSYRNIPLKELNIAWYKKNRG